MGMMENKSHNEKFDTSKSQGLSGRDRFVSNGPVCTSSPAAVPRDRWLQRAVRRGTTVLFQSHFLETKRNVCHLFKLIFQITVSNPPCCVFTFNKTLSHTQEISVTVITGT